MKIAPISTFYRRNDSTCIISTDNKVANKNTLQRKSDFSISGKGASKISFGETLIQDFLYKKSLLKHEALSKNIDPHKIESYFIKMGIPCEFNLGSDRAKQVIAYCCYNVAEIFKQIDMVLPTKISMEHIPANASGGYPIGACYFAPNYQKGFPIRTVVLNDVHPWEDSIMKSPEWKITDNGFHSTWHFLHTFIHEFAHNVHNHHLYSKFGCPFPNQGYNYNPEMNKIMEALNMKIYDENGNLSPNRYISTGVREILKKSSGYGSTLLPETFAEEFTRAIMKCINPMNLRLTKNPFPIITSNPKLTSVLYETWEGLIGDGKGYI